MSGKEIYAVTNSFRTWENVNRNLVSRENHNKILIQEKASSGYSKICIFEKKKIICEQVTTNLRFLVKNVRSRLTCKIDTE